MNPAELRRILTDKNLAQLGDSILNFTLSAALTKTTGKPTGRRVRNSLLTPLIDASSLKASLPLRTSRRDRANAFEALTGYLWLQESIKIDDLLGEMVRADDESMLESEREQRMLQAIFKTLVDRIEKPQAKTTA